VFNNKVSPALIVGLAFYETMKERGAFRM